MGFIYMLISPSGKSYIGQTTRPFEERFKDHQKPSSGCVAIFRAIQKYGWDNFEKHWYEVPDEDLNDHEELMVEVLGTLSPDGYNLMEGGGAGGKRCEEVKKKMSDAKKGDNHHFYGKAHTNEHKQNLSNAVYGENNPFYGHTHTYDTRQKMSENHPASKKVYQYTINGTFVKSFVSSGEAARSLNKKRGNNIRECANGKCPTAYGFKWSYTEI
ncbi:GIY-YIG catalytic domain-containing endonuclease [Acanthocystis turfacea Chlorella virus WI0606]|nr:GIY-YIG catalytic domain-containing endonuclease [Acanthocystis turfacea Chlorella virus WI0606]